MATVKEIFSAGPEFCSCCGSILPIATKQTNECFVCRTPIETNDMQEISYVVHFNDPDVYSKERAAGGGGKSDKGKKKKDEAEGPLVDRECKECGHKQMSYATLQLRSADEGQTVFYTCPKCKFKESENS